MPSPLIQDMEKVISACDERAAKEFLAQRYIDLPIEVQDHLAFAYFGAAMRSAQGNPDDSVSACELLSSIYTQMKRG